MLADDIYRREDHFEYFWKYSRMKEAFIAQRTRSKWLKEGDSNSRFFHASINKRSRDNTIHGFQIGGSWVEEVGSVKQEVHNHFKSLFNEVKWPRSCLDGVAFNKITQSEEAKLTAEITLKEIEEAVWNCDSNKSPGPDGYNFFFIKKFWHIIRDDFYRMFKEFHSN